MRMSGFLKSNIEESLGGGGSNVWSLNVRGSEMETVEMVVRERDTGSWGCRRSVYWQWLEHSDWVQHKQDLWRQWVQEIKRTVY